jgi:hypothetical protein
MILEPLHAAPGVHALQISGLLFLQLLEDVPTGVVLRDAVCTVTVMLSVLSL